MLNKTYSHLSVTAGCILLLVGFMVSCSSPSKEQKKIEVQANKPEQPVAIETLPPLPDTEKLEQLPPPQIPALPNNITKDNAWSLKKDYELDIWKAKEAYELKVWKAKEAYELKVWKQKESEELESWKEFDLVKSQAIQKLKISNREIYFQYLDAKETGREYEFTESTKDQDFQTFLQTVESARKVYSEKNELTMKKYSEGIAVANKFYSNGIQSAKEFYSKGIETAKEFYRQAQ